METSGSIGGERTVSSERVYSGRVVSLRVDTIALPDGRQHKREVVEHRGAVAIAAIDDAQRVLLVRQFRQPAGRDLLELPAGTLELGEDPLACAKRELEEETGYRAQRWEHVLSFYTAPGFSTELLHLYLASELTMGKMAAEEDEQIAISQLTLREARRLVDVGEICDAKSIIGLLIACERCER